MKQTGNPIDFSKWNTLPWWILKGYRTRDEAWADFSRAQHEFCYPEAFRPKGKVKPNGEPQ